MQTCCPPISITMNKQPSMYHHTAGYHFVCLAAAISRVRSHFTRVFFPAGLPGILLIIFLALFTLSFARIGKEYSSIVMQDKEKEATPLPPTLLYSRPDIQQFSFEYSGIFHLKVVVKYTPDEGLWLPSDMDITTNSNL